MQKELKQSVLKTLAYFDIANYPLTKEELYRYLWQPPCLSYDFFLEQLLEPNEDWQEKYGYYFLRGREEIVNARRVSALASARKVQKAKHAAKFIAAIPFLRAIFVCNSVGSEQASAESDIDFFIVTEPRRIWIVRFFTNLILRLFGLRTYGSKRQDRVCLSFFVDSDHMNLWNFRIAENDIHYIYWIQQMLPLYDPSNYYDRFLQGNSWINRFVPHRQHSVATVLNLSVHNTKFGKMWKKMWEQMWCGAYGNLVENEARQLQIHKINFSNRLKVTSKDDKGTVITNDVIKLHENDTRAEYLKKWQEKITQLC